MEISHHILKAERWARVGVVFDKEELNHISQMSFDRYLTGGDIVVLITNPHSTSTPVLTNGAVLQLLCKYGIAYTYDFSVKANMRVF